MTGTYVSVVAIPTSTMQGFETLNVVGHPQGEDGRVVYILRSDWSYQSVLVLYEQNTANGVS